MRLCLIVCLLLLAFGAAAQAQDPKLRGQAIAQRLCAPCHAIGKTDNSPREGAPPFRTLGRSFDLDEFPARLRRGLTSGHPAMPTFKFGGRDARAMRDYLRSIQD